VDGIRFIAIASVFLFHVTRLLYDEYPANRVTPFGRAEAADVVGRFLREGRLGVMVFFALSGFILAMPFVAARLGEGRPVSLGAYFLRRVTRIEPPYLVALALVALLAALTDAWVPAAFVRMERPSFVPTIDLTIHWRAPVGVPDGEHPWVLGLFSTRLGAGGTWEEDGELWSEDGTLLALSRQLAIVRRPR
jgi:peptidoglycan/LPS O-acetylase OafA/YrhL